MELQQSLADFERAGVAIFAVSYDTVDTLGSFAARRGIEFPLLSDEGSRTIRALGLFNEHVAEQHQAYGVVVREHHFGVPYPGTFVLDRDGVVIEKWFEQSYRVRPSAVEFLETSFGAESSLPVASAQSLAEGVSLIAWLGRTTYRPYQQLTLNVELILDEGLDVYGQPAPEGAVPLSVDIEPLEGLELRPPRLPEPQPAHWAGAEDVGVYAGVVRVTQPLILTKDLGDVSLAVRVRYQTGNGPVRFPSQESRLEFALAVLDNIRD